MKKVLITGAAGFLGRECVSLFRKTGYQVITTDRFGDVDICGDLSEQSFVSLLPDIDIIINCAAVQYINKKIPFFCKNSFFYKNNVLTVKNLSERYCSGVHFIQVSTSMVYVQEGSLLVENISSISGNGYYSNSKFKAQEYINNIPLSSTVFPCIIGGRGRGGLFKLIINMLKKYRLVLLLGQSSHPIQMVHVKDVSSLILTIAQTKSYGYYNAAGPGPLSIREWLIEISSILEIKTFFILNLPLSIIVFISKIIRYRFFAKEQLLMLKHSHILSIKKSSSIGWIPRYNNIDIIREITLFNK